MHVVACYIQFYCSITNTNTLNVTTAKHISAKISHLQACMLLI